jgi:DNA-directed RNA polymerase specialized sigma24 family protein
VIIDPTDGDPLAKGWQFDPDDPQHAGWRSRYTAFDEQWRPRLARFVRAVADRRVLAESEQSPEAVAQVALAKAALRWPEVEAMASPHGWVYTVAASLVNKAAGNRGRVREIITLEPGWTSAGVSGTAVEAPGAHRVDGQARERVDDVLDRLHPGPALAALTRLPFEQRVAVYLRDVDGFSIAQVAAVLGCSATEVYALLRGGRDRTRRNYVVDGRDHVDLARSPGPGRVRRGALAGVAVILAAVLWIPAVGRLYVDLWRALQQPEPSVELDPQSLLLAALATAAMVVAFVGVHRGSLVRLSQALMRLGRPVVRRARRTEPPVTELGRAAEDGDGLPGPRRNPRPRGRARWRRRVSRRWPPRT